MTIAFCSWLFTFAPTPLADITVYAQKFLSCVRRADEKFGAGHITDILLGSENEKVLRREHNKLSTYGIGKELTRKQWMHIARQLVTMGYLKQEGEYHTLSLTSRALEALRKREKIMGKVQEAERVKTKKAGKEELEYNHALFALLRQKRKELADEAGVPPYVIFSDKTLVEMAAHIPQSTEQLLTISGVGQMKLQQYGEAFLEVIQAYSAKHGLKEKPKEKPREKRNLSRRYKLVAEAYNAGETIEQLRERYQVMPGTIIDHLTHYMFLGNTLRKGTDIRTMVSATPEQQQVAFAAFEELGLTFLKPVHDRLHGALTYDELKILRLLYMVSQQPVKED